MSTTKKGTSRNEQVLRTVAGALLTVERRIAAERLFAEMLRAFGMLKAGNVTSFTDLHDEPGANAPAFARVLDLDVFLVEFEQARKRTRRIHRPTSDPETARPFESRFDWNGPKQESEDGRRSGTLHVDARIDGLLYSWSVRVSEATIDEIAAYHKERLWTSVRKAS